MNTFVQLDTKLHLAYCLNVVHFRYTVLFITQLHCTNTKHYGSTRGALGEVSPRPKGHTEPEGAGIGGLSEVHCSMLITVSQPNVVT